MKMAEVCKVFQNAGAKDVSSILASGNIIFSSADSVESLKSKLEKELSDYFDYEAFLFIRSEAEIKAIFSSSPFSSLPEYHNYIFITTEGTEDVLMQQCIRKMSKLKLSVQISTGKRLKEIH